MGSHIDNGRVEIVGELARKLPVVEQIELLTDRSDIVNMLNQLDELEEKDGVLYYKNIKLHIHSCHIGEFGYKQVELSSASNFWQSLSTHLEHKNIATEEDLFSGINLSFIPPELRDEGEILEMARAARMPELIEDVDIKGVVHNHSTYSDGIHSLEEMANKCSSLGYEYFVISDHSKSAFYANGLSEDRIYHQWEEIDRLNQEYGNDL